jgi:hypothetical protein
MYSMLANFLCTSRLSKIIGESTNDLTYNRLIWKYDRSAFPFEQRSWIPVSKWFLLCEIHCCRLCIFAIFALDHDCNYICCFPKHTWTFRTFCRLWYDAHLYYHFFSSCQNRDDGFETLSRNETMAFLLWHQVVWIFPAVLTMTACLEMIPSKAEITPNKQINRQAS